MRTTLFPNLTVDSSRIDYQSYIDDKMKVELTREHVVLGKFIKGVLSAREINYIRKVCDEKKRDVTVFTFLRHPVERVLSFYELFWGKNHSETPDVFERFFDYSHPEFQSHTWRGYVRTVAENSMTWQLGDTIFYNKRFKTEREVLRSAKRALKQMAFVGFFENLADDFLALRHTLLSHIEISPLYPLSMYLGARAFSPFHKVRSWTKKYSKEQIKMVERHVTLDLELYHWAVKEFTNHSKSTLPLTPSSSTSYSYHHELHLYDSYYEYFFHDIFMKYIWTVVALCVMVLFIFMCFQFKTSHLIQKECSASFELSQKEMLSDLR